ncbi:hypothetical protein LXA43DRAFT_1014102 [Ganoderma leucocontextum]|nr:hypothetical protein LXA43DRAFT_1014102 [Ganoderma leucocontextum]
MAVHISIFPPQVLTLICCFCDTADLRNLATTSRALSSAALQKIWHTLPSFASFVYTLPSDAWTYTDSEGAHLKWYLCESRTFILTRELVASDFSRFRAYSPLVRMISEPWFPRRRGSLSASIWNSFEQHCVEHLPNLHTLICRERSFEGICFADPFHIFLGPSMCSFDLSIHGGKDERPCFFDPTVARREKDGVIPLLELLTHLRQHCPDIRNFRLDALPFAFYAAEPLGAAICGWNHLWSLQALTTPLKASALKHLAALPSLRLLKANIHMPPQVLDDALMIQPHASTSFPVLRELVIHTNCLETCTSIVQAIRSPSLDDVILLANDYASTETVGSLCTALSRHIVLKNLTIGPGMGSRGHAYPQRRGFQSPAVTPDVEPAPLSPAILQPLLSLRALERIALDGTCYAELDDRAIAELAQAWPNLNSAKLCPEASHPFVTRVTLAGLAPLGALCKLDTIDVALSDVDARAIDAAFGIKPPHLEVTPLDATHPGRTSGRCPLQFLGVGRARLGTNDTEAVSAVLSAWFPELQRVECLINFGYMEPEVRRLGFEDLHEMDDLYWRWVVVGRAVRGFAMVREQEGRWAMKRRVDSSPRQAMST